MQPKKSPISIILFLMGGILVIIGQSQIVENIDNKHAWMLILVAIGLVFVFVGIWSLDKDQPRWLTRSLAWISSLSFKEWQLACLLFSLPIAIVVPLAAGTGQKMIHPIVAISAWFIAIGLVLAATWIQPAPLHWPSWRLVALFLGLTAFAFFLRVFLAGSIPAVLTGDEAAAGSNAENITHGLMNNIFITSWYAFPSFWFTLPAFFIGLFGHTTLALRIPSAIAGALTVTATFFVARAMFGKRTAWYAALFLAVLHFHIHFSRIGLNNIWDGLWYIVTIGSLWYGWEKNRRNAYLLAGLALGLSQYFYSSSHTILILILGWVVLAAIFDRPRLKQAWVNLFLMLFVTGIVALPLAWFYVEFPNTFMEPMARVALTSQWLSQVAAATGVPAWKIVLQQVGLAIGSFTYEPLRAWYTPGVPLLRPFAAGLFLIGLVLLFYRRQKWQIIPILLWLFAFMAIGGLSESTPAAQRYVAAAPVCALLVGFGLSESTALLENFFEKGKRWVAIISIILMAILAVDELHFYFFVFTPNSLISDARGNGTIAQTLANYLETEPKNLQVIFFGSPGMGYYSVPSIQYLVPEISGIDINQPWSSADKSNITSHHLLFVFLPNHLDQIAPVQGDYPGGKLKSIPAADGNLLYEQYEVATSP
ncbi:MAG: glycosyltransferase family 39 protein [Anaerolineales bacterium]